MSGGSGELCPEPVCSVLPSGLTSRTRSQQTSRERVTLADTAAGRADVTAMCYIVESDTEISSPLYGETMGSL